MSIQIGNRVRFDGNYRGVTPRIYEAKVLRIDRGLAGHDNPNPGRIFKMESDNGTRFSIDECQIIEVIR